MPFKSEIQGVELEGWVGGLNREADVYQLEVRESPDALNVDFGLRGEVSKRPGYVSYATHNAVASHIFVWQGNVIFVEAAFGDIWYLAGVTPTDSLLDLGAVTAPREYGVGAASMNNKLYLTRHGSTISCRRWDGTTWATVVSWDGTDQTARMPRSRTLLSAHNRFWAGNIVLNGGGLQKSRLAFSDVIDPESWKALNYFDVAPDDGQEITKMILFGDQIFVFKDHSIHTVVGSNELDFDVYPVDEELGTSAPGTVANVGLRMYFFDHLKGVHMFDGQGFTRVSEKVNAYLLNGVNVAQIHKAVGKGFRNRYYLSVPWGSDTVNSRTFVYDAQIQAWTEYDVGFADFALLDTEPLGVGVNNDVDVHTLFTGVTDDGAAIDAYMKTAWLSPGSPSTRHRLRRLDMNLSALGDYDVDIIMRRDFGVQPYVSQSVNTLLPAASFGTAVFGTATFGSGAEQLMYRDTGWGGRWRAVQFEFAERTDGDFQINRAILQVSANERQRGAF